MLDRSDGSIKARQLTLDDVPTVKSRQHPEQLIHVVTFGF